MLPSVPVPTQAQVLSGLSAPLAVELPCGTRLRIEDARQAILTAQFLHPQKPNPDQLQRLFDTLAQDALTAKTNTQVTLKQ